MLIECGVDLLALPNGCATLCLQTERNAAVSVDVTGLAEDEADQNGRLVDIYGSDVTERAACVWIRSRSGP